MRVLVIAMMLLTIMVGGCKKKEAEPQNTVKKDPVVTQINTITAPLTPEAAQSSNRVFVETVFNCGGKSKFTVRFKPNVAEIDVGWTKTVNLQQQITASGFWYKNAQYDLRGKGRQAALTVQGHKPLICTAEK